MYIVLILGIPHFDRLKYGVIRIWIWDNHECDSGVEAMVTLRNRHWEHFGIMHQRMGLLKQTNFEELI